VFRRFRDHVEISWDDEPLAGSPPGFHFSASRGVALLPPEAVAHPLRECALAAVTYLAEIKSGSKRLLELQHRLLGLDSPNHHEERLGWQAGLRKMPRA
jgi:hypothetical protein